jgi:hypothetical protein
LNKELECKMKFFLKGYGQTKKSSVYSALNYRKIL